MCNLGGEGEGKYRADFPKLWYIRFFVPCEKAGLKCGQERWLPYGVISESILLKRALQISTLSLSCSLICKSLHDKNSILFPKTSMV